MSAAFVGLTAGGGRHQVRAMRAAIEAAGERVFNGDYHVFILENDSNDGTKEALEEWADDAPCRVHIDMIDIGGTSKTYGNYGMRTKVLAMIRNRAMAMVKDFSKTFDFVISLDLDLEPFDPEMLARAAFGPEAIARWRDDWDAVCANGVYFPSSSPSTSRFYDVYAYRSPEFPHGPTSDEKLIPFGSYWGIFGDRPYMFEMQLRASRNAGDPAVKVASCFSGLAIYKAKLFEGCEYDAHYDCEHVHMHTCMAERHGLRMYMLPDLKVIYRLDEENLQQWADVERNYNIRLRQTNKDTAAKAGPTQPGKRRKKKEESQ